MSPCRGATAPLLRLPPLCRHVSLPSSASQVLVIPSVGWLPGAEGCPATPFNALTVSSYSRSSLKQAAGGCPACFPCLLPLCRLHVQAAQDEPGRCRRHAHGKPLLWGRQPGRKRRRTRWEAGPIVPGAKALCLHMQTRKEVVLACGRKLCLEGESPPLLFKPGDSS